MAKIIVLLIVIDSKSISIRFTLSFRLDTAGVSLLSTLVPVCIGSLFQQVEFQIDTNNHDGDDKKSEFLTRSPSDFVLTFAYVASATSVEVGFDRGFFVRGKIFFNTPMLSLHL